MQHNLPSSNCAVYWLMSVCLQEHWIINCDNCTNLKVQQMTNLIVIKHICFTWWRVPCINSGCAAINVHNTTQHISTQLKREVVNDTRHSYSFIWPMSIISYHVGSLRETNCNPTLSFTHQSEVKKGTILTVCVNPHKEFTLTDGLLTTFRKASSEAILWSVSLRIENDGVFFVRQELLVNPPENRDMFWSFQL